jgi:hypothetical protein
VELVSESLAPEKHWGETNSRIPAVQPFPENVSQPALQTFEVLTPKTIFLFPLTTNHSNKNHTAETSKVLTLPDNSQQTGISQAFRYHIPLFEPKIFVNIFSVIIKKLNL